MAQKGAARDMVVIVLHEEAGESPGNGDTEKGLCNLAGCATLVGTARDPVTCERLSKRISQADGNHEWSQLSNK